MSKLIPTYRILDPHRGTGRVAFDGDIDKYPMTDSEVYQMGLAGYYFPGLDRFERFKLTEEEVNNIVEYPPKVKWEDYSKFRKMTPEELFEFFPGLNFLLMKQFENSQSSNPQSSNPQSSNPQSSNPQEDNLIDDLFFYATRNYHPEVPNLSEQLLRWRIYCSVDSIIRFFFDWIYGSVNHDRDLQLYIQNSNKIIPIMPFLQKCENEGAYIFATVLQKNPLEKYLINYNDIMGNFSSVRTLAESMGFEIPLLPLNNNNDPDLYFISEIEKYLVIEPYQAILRKSLSHSSKLDIPLLSDLFTMNKNDYSKRLYPLINNQKYSLNNLKNHEESENSYPGRLSLLLNKYFEMLI